MLFVVHNSSFFLGKDIKMINCSLWQHPYFLAETLCTRRGRTIVWIHWIVICNNQWLNLSLWSHIAPTNSGGAELVWDGWDISMGFTFHQLNVGVRFEIKTFSTIHHSSHIRLCSTQIQSIIQIGNEHMCTSIRKTREKLWTHNLYKTAVSIGICL